MEQEMEVGSQNSLERLKEIREFKNSKLVVKVSKHGKRKDAAQMCSLGIII